ncbi:MAG TPA: ribonuclease [Allosphingosinicella sp.]|nr:ribonuclease [Allosphingosinicella sp.]
MAEWLYEEGIGENRAILVEGGMILEAAIELPGLRAGAVVPARLASVAGIATLEDGTEIMVAPLPPGLSEGAAFHAEIVREAMMEPGRPKPPKVRATDLAARPGPSLAERIGNPPPLGAVGPDRFEESGWSELLEQAETGEIEFAGGALRMSLTPAMTLFDVDGSLPPTELAEAGAEAAARTILRFGIAGSIGIDLPTLPREGRQAAAAAVDRVLPQPFERSAVNGFGFLQIVRRRVRPSLPELVRADPVSAAARALLRRAGRVGGPVTIHAAPRVIAAIEARPDWLAALARLTGGGAALLARPGLAISAGHAERRQA